MDATTRTLGLGLFLTACLVESGCQGQSAKGNGGGEFLPLFNGRDPSGWVQVLDSEWVVRDGALFSRQDPDGRREGESWLFSERNYRDFVLKLKFRITPGGNSGVFLRDPVAREERLEAADGGPPPWEAGYEVNINSDEPNYPTGSVWAAAKGPQNLQQEGEWNELRIHLQGDRIWTWVNGKPALDGAELPVRAREGAVGFQRHGGATYQDKLIEFKDVEIKEL